MSRFISYLQCLIAASLWVACTQNTPNQQAAMSIKRHFDLKGYFEGEILRLGNRGRAKKVVYVKGKKESKIMDSVDFQRELRMFSMSDINRPAWSGKYLADSSFDNQNHLTHLEIVSLDMALKTQRIVVDFQDEIVSKVQIHNNSVNSIALSNQVLTYEPAFGYSIESNQKVALSSAQDFMIEVHFIK